VVFKRLARCAAPFETKVFLLSKLDRAESYRDVTGENRRRTFVSGALFYLKKGKPIYRFSSAAFTRHKNVKRLPEFNVLVKANLSEIAKKLPTDPKQSVKLEREENW